MILMLQLGVPLRDHVRPLVHRFQRLAVSMLTKTPILRLQLTAMQALTVKHTIQRFVSWQSEKRDNHLNISSSGWFRDWFSHLQTKIGGSVFFLFVEWMEIKRTNENVFLAFEIKVSNVVVMFSTFLIFQGCYDALKEKLQTYSLRVIAVVSATFFLEVFLFC